MKKIFINTPYSSDGNSFWRCMGPMSYLAKNSEYSIHCPEQGSSFQWDGIAQYDLIFMHRPCRPDDIKLMQMARTMNIPVWSDYDDWLFHLPNWNPHKKVYHNPNIQSIMAAAITLSDVVSVTTTLLQHEFSKLNNNVVIVPNAYREDLFPFRSDTPKPRKDEFYWRGSSTHDGDLISVLDGLRSLSKKTHFMGGSSSFVLSQMDPKLVEEHDTYDTIRYWKVINDLGAKVMIFPLDGHYFNQCKSNIAWIEAMHAGSVIVAPDLPEWKHPGIISYTCNDSVSFLAACEQAMAMTEDQVKEANHDGYVYMKSKFGIRTVNQIREAILKSIFSPTFERNKKDPFDHQLYGLLGMSLLTGTPLPRLEQGKVIQPNDKNECL